jgi:dTDP-4-amino-4,6-dideoxygalactose transaminase
MVGVWGDAGAFSFHNDKLVSAGEGGIVTTNKEACFLDVQALRLDGFDWAPNPVPFIDGLYAQSQGGRVMGTSLALAEASCALALEGLARLHEQTRVRDRNGERLCRLLGEIPGLAPIQRTDGLEIRPFYEFAVRINGGPLRDLPIATVCKALAAELGFPVYPETPALTRNMLYKPAVRKRYGCWLARLKELSWAPTPVPVAERAAEEVLMFLHPPLLGTSRDIDDIATAFAKVARHGATLVEMERSGDLRLGAELPYWPRCAQQGVAS